MVTAFITKFVVIPMGAPSSTCTEALEQDAIPIFGGFLIRPPIKLSCLISAAQADPVQSRVLSTTLHKIWLRISSLSDCIWGLSAGSYLAVHGVQHSRWHMQPRIVIHAAG